MTGRPGSWPPSPIPGAPTGKPMAVRPAGVNALASPLPTPLLACDSWKPSRGQYENRTGRISDPRDVTSRNLVTHQKKSSSCWGSHPGLEERAPCQARAAKRGPCADPAVGASPSQAQPRLLSRRRRSPAVPGLPPSLLPALPEPGGWASHRTGRGCGGLGPGRGHEAAILRLTQDLASDGGHGQGGSRTFYLDVPPTSFVFSCGFME